MSVGRQGLNLPGRGLADVEEFSGLRCEDGLCNESIRDPRDPLVSVVQIPRSAALGLGTRSSRGFDFSVAVLAVLAVDSGLCTSPKHPRLA